MSEVSFKDVLRSVSEHNPHAGTGRDALQAMPYDAERLVWRLKDVALAALPPVSPASERDARRYAQHAKKTGVPFPPVVVVRRGGKYEIYDGEHRIFAARILGHEMIAAFVGSHR